MGAEHYFRRIRAACRFCAMVFLVLMLLGADTLRPPIAIVVNNENPLAGLTLEELKRIYLGKQTLFSNDIPVLLGISRDLSSTFYKSALGMPAHAVKRHWIKVVFAGSRATPPEPLEGADNIKSFVESNRGAIAFLAFDEVDQRVRVITVGEKSPDQHEYPIR